MLATGYLRHRLDLRRRSSGITAEVRDIKCIRFSARARCRVFELAAIGALVGITKSLIEIAKDLGSLFSGSSGKERLTAQLAQLYGRIDVLAVQLEQSEQLTRMVPAWLELANRMPMWQKPSGIDGKEAKILDRDLRSLIHESIRDHFSATFFQSSFDQLPEVPLKLEIFRDRLRTLDKTISTVQPGNIQSLEALWSQITTQFNDTRNAATEIHRLADEVQGRLIKELRDAAKQGLEDLKT